MSFVNVSLCYTKNTMVSSDIFAPIFIATIFIPLILWSVIWKGIALWRSAQNRQTAWFIALLIINTAGILEIIYLLFFAKRQVNSSHHRDAEETAISKLAESMKDLSTRQQAILAILTSLLDREHQHTISKEALTRIMSAIEQRLDGAATQAKLLKALDTDMSKGGAGLYTQTAQRIASHIEAIIKAAAK